MLIPKKKLYVMSSCPISFEPLTLKSSLNYDKNTFDISIESSNPISVDMFQRKIVYLTKKVKKWRFSKNHISVQKKDIFM
ncbi:hypothetical protein Mgra_00004530, partial [Meloidogyne graminicola]